MNETISDSAPDPRRAAPSPLDSNDETLASGQVPRGPAAPSAGSALAFSSKERDLSGAQLGEYRLVRKIAVGGMGEVYEGVQLKLDRRVAVKLLSEELSREKEFLARFEREAKSAAALNHPNVVQVYDYGCAEGQYYFVMELVDGVDLSMHVKEHGKVPIPEALGYFEQAVNALKFAARHAIIHRDVKPANLMLTRDGTVKVSDLGLAKKLTDDSDVTMTGVGMGSPHFLAPEQADDAAHVDHRADIYSLGVTLLFLLTGRRPYEGASNFSVVLAHANKPLPTGFDLGTPLPDELERFIKRMTAKHPAARYQDYEELLADLQRVKAGHGLSLNLGLMARDPRNLQRLAITAVTILIAALAVPLLLPGKKPALTAPAKSGAAPSADPRPSQVPPVPADREERPRFGGTAAPARKLKGRDTEGRIELPFPPPPQKIHNPLKDGPIPEMMAEADRYAAQNKDMLTGIVDRYWQITRKAEGTSLQAEAQRKTDNAMLTHELKSHELIEKLQAQMESLLQQGKAQEAYNAWRAYPTDWRTRETDEEIVRILNQFMPSQFEPTQK
ncbi:MAG: serine/threonine protein kinase [Verrucomicrobia bacterium]|nr:serine/threonine protein kinase [Verrucomicrobiota bacterium]